MKTRSGHLFKRGDTWHVQWRLNGKLFSKSTGETDRKKAEKERAKIMAPFIIGNENAVLSNIATRIEGGKAEIAKLEDEQHPPLTIDHTWSAYVAAQNRPDSGSVTLANYRGHFSAFVSWLSKNHKTIQTLREVTPAIASEYAAHLAAKISPNTFNKSVRLLELLFRVLRGPAKLTLNPWEDIQRKRNISQSRRELTTDELKTVCGAATGEMRVLFALGIYTGLRRGDCATLRWAEVDLTRHIIRRIPSKVSRRNPRPVLIPIHQVLSTILEGIPNASRDEYVLPETAAQYQRDPQGLSRKIQDHFIACGIRTVKPGTGVRMEKGEDGRKMRVRGQKRAVVEVGFHSLRHTFVSLCREANAPLAVVEAIVGHSNPAMTRHYTHVSELAAGQAVAALPTILGDNAGNQPAPLRMVDATAVQELAERLTAANANEIKAEMLALANGNTTETKK